MGFSFTWFYFNLFHNLSGLAVILTLSTVPPVLVVSRCLESSLASRQGPPCRIHANWFSLGRDGALSSWTPSRDMYSLVLARRSAAIFSGLRMSLYGLLPLSISAFSFALRPFPSRPPSQRCRRIRESNASPFGVDRQPIRRFPDMVTLNRTEYDIRHSELTFLTLSIDRVPRAPRIPRGYERYLCFLMFLFIPSPTIVN
jgi:hypothetical protein